MDNYFEDALHKLEVFFTGGIKSSDGIFKVLKSIFDFDKGFVYFLTPDRLRLEYSYPDKKQNCEILITNSQKNSLFNLTKPVDTDIFKIANTLAERLVIQNNPYGILVVQSQHNFSQQEKSLFKTCALIISNLIKDIELTKIIKIQTKALQNGIIETDKAYKIIKLQNKKIIETDKIKNKFLSNVSHELRTPLNSIIGFSELLQNPALGNLNEKQSEYIKDIQIAGIHLLAMINEILDISKLEAHSLKLNLKTFKISQCIDETLNILKPLYERKNINICKTISDTSITADYQKIQQILFNLLNNAIKFTENNGDIKISVITKRKYICISIKDNGCGIDKKYHRRIFKKFEQISQTENSTGLGLTITKELVTMHCGNIKVISDTGKGAEFVVKLPISSV